MVHCQEHKNFFSNNFTFIKLVATKNKLSSYKLLNLSAFYKTRDPRALACNQMSMIHRSCKGFTEWQFLLIIQ